MRAGGYYSEQKQSNYGMLVMPKTRRRLGFRLVQKLTCQDSAVCNRQLLDAIASAWRCGELFICVKHVMWEVYEMQRKYFGWAETYG